MILDRPTPYPSALPDPRGVYELGDEVPPEGPPKWAILGGVDGALADAEEQAGRRVGRAGSKERATLDESLVDELRARDDDKRALAHLHGKDRAILRA